MYHNPLEYSSQYNSNMEELTQQPTVNFHQSELNWLMNKLWELGWKGFSEEEVQRAINIRDKNNLPQKP